MKCAIYARKSTDDSDKAADNKSVERQFQHAKEYALKRGWEVLQEHVYVDDGVSGAEYLNRPSLFKLLDHLKDFDKLVMSESSRLGRDMTRNSYYLTTIIEAGIEVFYYLTDEQEKADTPEARLMLTLKSYASEVERQKASERSRDALKRRAEKGYNTGGVTYGFDNVPVYTTGVNGEQVKAHTDYRINPNEAETLRQIFTMYADGHGHVVIAKTLNGDSRYRKHSLRYFDGKTPPPPRKGSGSWSPSSIYCMLRNDRYIGLIPWGEHRKVYKQGTKKREKQAEYLKARREDLIIIPHDLWEKVQKRIKATQATYIRDAKGHLWSKPDNGRTSKYLLSGFVRCGVCGANMIGIWVLSGGSGRKRVKDYRYHCAYHHNRGESVCNNRLKPRMKELDALVLDAIKKSVLDKDNIEYVIKKAMEEVARLQKEQPNRGAALEKELRKTEGELKNFLSLIADGNAPKSVLQEIRAKEGKIEALKAEVARYTAPAHMDELDFKRLERNLRERLEQFEELIHGDVPVARQALRKLLKKPLILKPEENGYILEGESSLGALFPEKVKLASPRGFEPRSPP